MNFQNLTLKREYRSFNSDIVNEFYIPVLNNSVLYRRAVGFFSSTSLAEISKGITGLIKNNGRIELIASPKLSEEDIEAIRLGYKLKNEVIEERLISELREPKDYFESERLNVLAHLIANDRLNIKIALLNMGNEVGIYHEKLGITYDNDGNKVVFTGSLNETGNALKINYESIDVFTSWNDRERVEDKEKAFCSIWENRENGLEVLEFPKVKDELLKRYKKESINYEFCEDSTLFKEENDDNEPRVPDEIQLHDYQKNAIEAWKSNDFVGIFDMATGTGKTFTAIAALTELYSYLKGKIFAVIVCPYTHLVEQWVDDLKKFNIEPVVGYSESSDINYKKKLKRAVIDYNLGIINSFFFITTNATYRSEFVQSKLKKLKGDAVIIVDEAHNLGATNLSNTLINNFNFRLALSATLERHNDEEGTKKLFDYFGEKCIEYTLKQAIEDGKLTPYYYYPVIVYLTDNELRRYKELSKEIAKNIVKLKNGKTKLNTKGEMLSLERSRLVAAAFNKVEVLEECIEQYKDSKHMLVYCGAANVYEDDEYLEYDEGRRQIDYITEALGSKLKIKVAQFTSKENNSTRKLLKEKFAEGEDIQALIAIRCLDEGVNIPEVQTAFILASSRNPKEYIQRRGRVLRLSKGKKYAKIYDFITLPRDLSDVKGLTEQEIAHDISLIKNEVQRMIEFKELALNSWETDKLFSDIQDAYPISVYNF